MSDQLVAEAATYTTHNKHSRKFMSFAGFEPAVAAVETQQFLTVFTKAYCWFVPVARWSTERYVWFDEH
jgi:hypothetical protein